MNISNERLLNLPIFPFTMPGPLPVNAGSGNISNEQCFVFGGGIFLHFIRAIPWDSYFNSSRK